MHCQSSVKPAGRLSEGECVYVYDGSFDGFLCCVFESFAAHELPFDIWSAEREEATLFPIKEITTDTAKSQRVFASFKPKLGAAAERLVTRDFLSGREDKELLLLKFLHFAYSVGPGAALQYGHADVAPLYEMKKSLDWEVDKFQGFVRFEEHESRLISVIHPQNYILPLIRRHFCSRFPEENFLIYDASHNAVLLYVDHRAQLIELAVPLQLPPPDEREKQFQAMWKRFYDTLAIASRRNERCRMTHCPKRFWGDMVEMRGEK